MARAAMEDIAASGLCDMQGHGAASAGSVGTRHPKGEGWAVSITRDPPSQQVRDVRVSQNKGIYNVGMIKLALNQILFCFVFCFFEKDQLCLLSQ